MPIRFRGASFEQMPEPKTRRAPEEVTRQRVWMAAMCARAVMAMADCGYNATNKNQGKKGPKSRNAFAKKMGVSSGWLSKFLAGSHKDVSAWSLKRFADTAGVSVGWLIEGNADESASLLPRLSTRSSTGASNGTCRS